MINIYSSRGWLLITKMARDWPGDDKSHKLTVKEEDFYDFSLDIVYSSNSDNERYPIVRVLCRSEYSPNIFMWKDECYVLSIFSHGFVIDAKTPQILQTIKATICVYGFIPYRNGFLVMSEIDIIFCDSFTEKWTCYLPDILSDWRISGDRLYVHLMFDGDCIVDLRTGALL